MRLLHVPPLSLSLLDQTHAVISTSVRRIYCESTETDTDKYLGGSVHMYISYVQYICTSRMYSTVQKFVVYY